MKIRNLIIWLMVLVLFLSTSISLILVATSIYKKGKKDIARIKTEELEKVQKDLKNFVDIAYETIEINHKNSIDKKFIQKDYGQRVKTIINIAISLIEEQADLVKQGKLDLEEAQARAKSVIKRISNNADWYIWIKDFGKPYPKMIMHPILPQLDGKVLNDPKYNCAMGREQNLFQAMVDVCTQDGEGFVDYIWPKPTKTGLIPNMPKLSYTKAFKEWGWILGTGIYIDDSVAEAKNESKLAIKKMRYNNGEGYFWINDTKLPYPRMLMHPTIPSLDGKMLDNEKYNCALGKKQNLFQAMVEVSNKSGEGFVDYTWPKPTPKGLLPDMPKLSFVKLFPKWQWIVGTGVYIDQIDNIINHRKTQVKKHVNSLLIKVVVVSFGISFLGILLSIYFANYITKPIRKFISIVKNIKLENLANTNISIQGPEEIQVLGEIYNNTLLSLDKAVKDLEKTTAAKERIESELNVAKEIQLSMIPRTFPAYPKDKRFDIHALLEAAYSVGGDLYDFFFIDKDRFCFCVGDVSGKGVSASLFMAVTRTLLRTKAQQFNNPGEILTAMNKELSQNNEMMMFVTFFMGILDFKARKVYFANAGHNLPYIITPNHKLQVLEKSHGLPLAVDESSAYAFDTIDIKENTTIFLYTDGVTEAENISGQLYDENRLESVLKDNLSIPPEEMLKVVREDISKFVGAAQQADDITMLTIWIK